MKVDTILEFDYRGTVESTESLKSVVDGEYTEETSGETTREYKGFYFRAEDYQFSVESGSPYTKNGDLFLPVTVEMANDSKARQSTIYFDAIPTISGKVSTHMAKQGCLCVFNDFTVPELPEENITLGRRLADFTSMDAIVDYYKSDKTDNVILLNDLSEKDIDYLKEELSVHNSYSMAEQNIVYNIFWVNQPESITIKIAGTVQHSRLENAVMSGIDSDRCIYDKNGSTHISVEYDSDDPNRYLPNYIISGVRARLHRRLSPNKSPEEVVRREPIVSMVKKEVGGDNIVSTWCSNRKI